MARYLLTVSQKQTVFAQRRLGETWQTAAEAAGCLPETARKMVFRAGGCAPRERAGRPGSLTVHEREEIMIGLAQGSTFTAIAKGLGRTTSTVSREVKANGGRTGYRAQAAQCSACDNALRARPSKLETNLVLRAYVEKHLALCWSPQQISLRLVQDYPHDLEMRVSYETIYMALYVQSKGQLNRELCASLRTHRTRRKLQSVTATKTRIADMEMIADRPSEVEDRSVPGHWEGDLIIGKSGASAIATLVERTTRFVMLVHLEGDRRAETVREAITTKIQTLPEQLRVTLTWDQGIEMAQHATFTIDTNVKVYFCDPHSPWQRGTNENTNGLLRQYFPKGTDLSVHSQQDLDRVAQELNGRPRATLSYATPTEKLTELLALTA